MFRTKKIVNAIQVAFLKPLRVNIALGKRKKSKKPAVSALSKAERNSLEGARLSM